jgi:S-DNA-T family DNA segregation ATPase FtsK/SpoIIIE
VTTPISPVPRGTVKFSTKVNGDEVAVTVKPPANLKKEAPPSIGRTIVIRSVIVLMVCVFGLMMYLGIRQFNPMMMMSMFGVLGMLGAVGGGAHLMGGNNPQGELNIERQDYATHLREQRSNAHVLGRHIHSTQTAIYPHPDTLESRCGDNTLMWTTAPPRENTVPTGFNDRELAESAQINPWGSARIGVGYRRMDPYIKPTANDAPETYEPVQAAAYMRFIRTHNVIPDCPIGVDVFARPFIVCAGDADKLLSAARAMMCSLADNHAPRHLQLGIITDELQEWEWMKWFPHCLDPARRDKNGPARLHWSTIADYAQDQADLIQKSLPHSANRDNLAGNPYRVVFVDVPGQAPTIPAGISTAGIADHTFVYVRHS